MAPEDNPADDVEPSQCEECDGDGWVYDDTDGGTKDCPACGGSGMQ